MSDTYHQAWDFTAALSAIAAVQSRESSPLAGDSLVPSPPSLTQSLASDSGDGLDVTASPPALTLGNLDKVFGFLGVAGPTPKSGANITSVGSITASQDAQQDDDLDWLNSNVQLDQNPQAALEKTRNLYMLPSSPQNPQTKLSSTIASTLHGSLPETDRSQAGPFPKADANRAAFHATSDTDTDTDGKAVIELSKARRNIIQELLAPTTGPKKTVKQSGPHDFFAKQVSDRYASEPAPDSTSKSWSTSRDLSKHGNKTATTVELNSVFQKKQKLLQLLHQNFPEESAALSCMPPPSTNAAYEALTSQSSGIHVFVDMSNILIGFHNALKLNRGLSILTRIPRQQFSFYNFSLVLERGRSVAKRCLAGSQIVESVEEAVELGYENNCLDRVLKAQKMTPRKKYFNERDRQAAAAERSGASSGGEGFYSGTGSGRAVNFDELTKKYVEQAVDEVLHLKMMESLVDHEPSTIVLATGDAAQAEFSEGFLRMCERALLRGWKVELVSFKANLSSEYRRRDWIARWNGNFRIIGLDEYVEMLRI